MDLYRILWLGMILPQTGAWTMEPNVSMNELSTEEYTEWSKLWKELMYIYLLWVQRQQNRFTDFSGFGSGPNVICLCFSRWFCKCDFVTVFCTCGCKHGTYTINVSQGYNLWKKHLMGRKSTTKVSLAVLYFEGCKPWQTYERRLALSSFSIHCPLYKVHAHKYNHVYQVQPPANCMTS